MKHKRLPWLVSTLVWKVPLSPIMKRLYSRASQLTAQQSVRPAPKSHRHSSENDLPDYQLQLVRLQTSNVMGNAWRISAETLYAFSFAGKTDTDPSCRTTCLTPLISNDI